MQVGLACRKFAGEHIDRFDGDLPHPVRRPAQSPMSRTPSRAVTFSDPGAARARSMPRAVTASRHAPAPVLCCALCMTVPSARRSR